jgi:hypothetical protein
MNFNPSKVDTDIWMRDCGDHCEYIACYMDNLMIASRQPQAIIDALTKPSNNFKLKGTGPVAFHLGCDFFRDEDGTVCVGPKTYINRMAMQYESMFGSKPRPDLLHSTLGAISSEMKTGPYALAQESISTEWTCNMRACSDPNPGRNSSPRSWPTTTPKWISRNY